MINLSTRLEVFIIKSTHYKDVKCHRKCTNGVVCDIVKVYSRSTEKALFNKANTIVDFSSPHALVFVALGMRSLQFHVDPFGVGIAPLGCRYICFSANVTVTIVATATATCFSSH